MNILLLFSHPVEESYGARLHAEIIHSLTDAGHEVDDCNLYTEGFDPVLSRDDRLNYYNYPDNAKSVEGYVERLRRAEALVIVTPVWNFGFPAILKGYFDRVWVPGVSFDLVDGRVRSKLRHIRKLGAVLTYGAHPLRAFMAGNPPKKIVKRVLRAQIATKAKVSFLAHYDMNRSTDETRKAFVEKVGAEFTRF